ncbi:MAG: ABC transporter permease [Propionibacteriaceae bacterium]|jgi:oligopeptide transport system permease protein|nr:ABC transporter permease [Propionibacteriaceae bacterium]
MNATQSLPPDVGWEPIPTGAHAAAVAPRPGRSFWQDVWYRFRQKKLALGGGACLLLIAVLAIAGPSLTGYSYSAQQSSLANVPPWLALAKLPQSDDLFYINPHLKVIEVTPDGRLVRQVTQTGDDMVNKRMSFDLDGATLYLDYSAQPPALLDPDGQRVPATSHHWNTSYLLGTDALGRDILTRTLYGCRISLAVAVVAALVNMVIGIVYGGVSGYAGGMIDVSLMRVVDIISTIPLTLYVILIKVVLGSGGFLSIVIALSSVYWVDMARVVRGQALSLKGQEFVLAARTIGAGPGAILKRHIVPNAMGPILVTATMLIPSAIFIEAFLSFIGIGIAPPMASLGTMCNDALTTLRASPYQLLIPAAAICVIMFAFNFVGDGLRDALDPKLRQRP